MEGSGELHVSFTHATAAEQSSGLARAKLDLIGWLGVLDVIDGGIRAVVHHQNTRKAHTPTS